MTVISLYLYDVETLRYTGSIMGNPKNLFLVVGSDKDYTLTPPPDNRHYWRWLDNQWVNDGDR